MPCPAPHMGQCVSKQYQNPPSFRSLFQRSGCTHCAPPCRPSTSDHARPVDLAVLFWLTNNIFFRNKSINGTFNHDLSVKRANTSIVVLLYVCSSGHQVWIPWNVYACQNCCDDWEDTFFSDQQENIQAFLLPFFFIRSFPFTIDNLLRLKWESGSNRERN